ncbi:MAG: hypothetical protein Q7I99_07935 [Acholeplasmataceae bacterium]|nr:hypothetical protein [Acholeplasmataceae bacterium]
MKKPAILIMSVTLMMIGVLVLEYHLSSNRKLNMIPDDYFEFVDLVSNQESRIILLGDNLPFPESIQHQVLSSFDELSNSILGENDFIIIHASKNSSNHCFTLEEILMLKLFNQQGVTILFVGLSSYDFLNIDSSISTSYPYGVGVIKMNPNSFDQGDYEIYAPQTTNLELRLYNVLRMMVSR